MILADLLYDLSNQVIITDHWSSDLFRMTITVTSSLVAFLLAELYLSHRTGRMNWMAGTGAVGTYMVIAWAQLVALSNPVAPKDLTALNVGVLVVVVLSLAGVIQAMDVHLFRRSDPKPGPIRKALDQLDRVDRVVQDNADKLDEIDRAVNTRPTDQPTISEDVRSLVEDSEKRKKRK